jgi:RNA polymerase sigma-54 factor
MALSHKLELRHSQSLVMTPQLMQAIKLLQLSNLDLVAYVDAELERNPLLERAEGEDSGDEASEDDKASANEAVDTGEEADWTEARLDTDAEAVAGRLDADLGATLSVAEAKPADAAQPMMTPDAWSTTAPSSAASVEDYNLEGFVAEERTLADHLSDQLGLAVADPARRLVGQAIINEIDEAGYLQADVADLAERLGAPAALVEETLAIVQSFEPAGVAARDLAECLAIQLRERDRFDPAMATLIANLDLVARREHGALRRLCGVDEEDLADMLAELRDLNPKPGNAFGTTHVQPIVPDVIVRPAQDGGWQVELNTGTLPKVLVNQTYYASVARHRKNDTDKAYLADCLQTANWLVKSLDQRARTILKVASEIVRQQDAFLAEGVQHLRPLNLKTIAEAIGMHESTVSRVTSNKYMATPRGIFELKYFFTASIASAEGGEAHSAEAVRFRIRKLIDDEPAQAILSDDTIVRMLRDRGVDIARRTVAKYREAMRIPSSVQRRREKQAAS